MIDVALERVPDDPWRVDTRGMLLSGRAEVSFAPEPESAADGFVVSISDAALVSIVGRPPRPLIIDVVRGLDGLVTVLCQPGDARHAAGALAGWKRTIALLHTLPARPEWDEGIDEDTRIFSAADAPPLAHLPGRLRRELVNALRGRTAARFVPGELPDRDIPPPLEPTPMAAAWAGHFPVSFCYPALRTERWWDLSIETLRIIGATVRRPRRSSDDPAHVANGPIARLGLDHRQRRLVGARAESGISGSRTARRVQKDGTA